MHSFLGDSLSWRASSREYDDLISKSAHTWQLAETRSATCILGWSVLEAWQWHQYFSFFVGFLPWFAQGFASIWLEAKGSFGMADDWPGCRWRQPRRISI